ncbi:MAG: DUF4445 domain-containing protein [Chitinivibrionales bacterium]|nr:DUF4445 domain-containing protein [Chitinivibrionales bacterium]
MVKQNAGQGDGKSSMAVKVTVLAGGVMRVIDAREGQMLLDVLRVHGVELSAACGGRGTCGKCGVDIDGLGRVLSCRHALQHDITVRVPLAGKAAILHDAGLLEGVENDCGLSRGNGGSIVSTLPGAERTIVPRAAPPGLYGIAIDIGTTTVVVYLEDLLAYETRDVVSFVNPQTVYGHDVVSRIHYTMEHENGVTTLRDELLREVNRAIEQLCSRNGIDTDALYKATVVGNTTMLHLFMGVDPSSIAAAPYTPRFIDRRLVDGRQSGLSVNAGAVVIVLPSVSGYVGADITAGIAATELRDTQDYSLFVDIGTNGEMALGNSGELFCCSTAAGPAFEGATIACGTGGIEGAIARYAGGTYETIGGVTPAGICGSGILDIAADLRATGRIDVGGLMESDHLIVPASSSATGTDIVFTPADVREVQLATAAIYAGLNILMKESGVTVERVTRLYLAGGFGNYLRVESAIAVGLLPMSLQGRIVPVGNSAGSGARLALRSKQFDARVERTARAAKYIELSMRMDFNEEYVMAMNLERRG